MFVMGYGISMDVENLTFAVLDRDQTTISRDYVLNLAGSRYFVERRRSPTTRISSGACAGASSPWPSRSRPASRATSRAARPCEIGAWIDGAMPSRAETVRGYVQGMHAHWLTARARAGAGAPAETIRIETRFRYNPDVQSLVAMVPAVIPLLLLLIPAMLSAAVGRAGEGAGLHRQSLRHPGDPAGVPARQAAPLRRRWPC